MPNPGNPQHFNRYSYVVNNPLSYVDPSGHVMTGAYDNEPDLESQLLDKEIALHQKTWGKKISEGTDKAIATGMDFTPVLGDAKGVAEVFTGKDLITGESLGAWRWLGLICLSELRIFKNADEAGGALRSFREIAEEGIQGVSKSIFRFADDNIWMKHFQKHGAEFGYNTAEEYLQGAQKLVSGGEGVSSFTRTGGDTLFYNAAKNEFAVLSNEEVIRTYFKPKDGIDYWIEQIQKELKIRSDMN